MKLDDLVFAGLNCQVVALEQATGEIVWRWGKKGRGPVLLVVEAGRVIVSVNGYLWALDALTGEELWHNPLKGYGTGIAALATAQHCSSPAVAALHVAAEEQAAAAAAAAAAGS